MSTAKRNPEGQPEEQDYLMSTAEAATYLTGLQKRARPYTTATIRGWLDSGQLKGEQDDFGRWSVRMSELQRWAADRGVTVEAGKVEKKAPEPVAIQTNPDIAQKAGKGTDPAPAQPAAEPEPSKQGGRFRLVPLAEDEEEEEDFAYVVCPNPDCGAEVPVSSASVIVQCPGCSQEMQVLEKVTEEEDELAPVPAPKQPEPLPVQSNPSFFGFSLGRKRPRR